MAPTATERQPSPGSAILKGVSGSKGKDESISIAASGKGAGKGGLSPKTKAALATVALTAVERLSDPRVRAQLADQGRNLAKQVNQWRSERTTDGAHRSRAVRNLEKRATTIRASVARLSSERPDRAGALGEADQVLDEIDLAIGVADGLPKATRREAIARLDVELDRVERLVFDAALPSSGR